MAFPRGEFHHGMGNQRYDSQGASNNIHIVRFDPKVSYAEPGAFDRHEMLTAFTPIVQEPDRAVQFRNLGRGWVFVLVRRHKRTFKVWFESIRRVEWNHQVNACW